MIRLCLLPSGMGIVFQPTELLQIIRVSLDDFRSGDQVFKFVDLIDWNDY